MSLSLLLACLWVLAANVAAMLPSRKNHWPAAYVLIACGVPLLGFVWFQHGIWPALICLIAALSILRWPLRYLIGWLRRKLT